MNPSKEERKLRSQSANQWLGARALSVVGAKNKAAVLDKKSKENSEKAFEMTKQRIKARDAERKKAKK